MDLKKLFSWGAPETKSFSGGAELQGLPPVRWSERTARTYASEGYERCVIVARCVQIVSKSVASIPVKVLVNGEEVEDHPVLQLLKKPNPTMGGATFMEKLVSMHQITGNTYVEALVVGGQPKELWLWPPFAMKVAEPSKGFIPKGFVYDDGTPAHKRSWEVNPITGACELLQVKTFNPLDPWYGLSPIATAAFAADQHNEANTWNMRLLQNASVPSGALMTKTALTNGQFKSFKEELEETYQGAKNARRPMILGGDMSWIQMSLSPMEMDWLNGKNLSAREICAAYGVPTQVVPIQGDQTFANYGQARMALWQDTVIPLAKSIYDDKARWFSQLYDEDITFELDLNKVPALEDARKEKWAMVQASTFLTTNEKREAVGYEPIEDVPMADRILSPGAMQPMPTTEEQKIKDAQAEAIANGAGPGTKPGDKEPAPGEDPTTPDAGLKDQVKRQLKAIGIIP